VTVSGSSASYVFTGLTNGTGYTFQVRATNVVGQGEVSDASATARPYGAPSAPTSATATGSSNGSGTVTLNWGGAGGNGRNIDGYRITMSPGGAVLNVGDVTTTTFAGTVGTAYSYSIVTLGAGGESPAFSSTNSGIPRPGPPASASASWSGPRGDRTVDFSWTAAPSTEPITRYEVLVNNYHSSWQDVGSATSYSIEGNFGTSYSIQVRAVSAGQTGDPRTSNAVTPLDVLPPDYNLCWHNQYSGYYNVGIRYSNVTGSHTVKVDFASSSGTTSGANGTVRLQAWHSGGQGDGNGNGDNNDNAAITILVDGSAFKTVRWGDAPAC
jgi:hypothetical protein